MRLVWFMWLRRLGAAIRGTASVLAAARSVSTVLVAAASAGAEAFLAGATFRAIVVAATLEAHQTVRVGIATDESVATIELRSAVVGNADFHREAGAIELDSGWAAPALDAALAIRTVDRVRAVLVAALDITTAFTEAADLAVATIVVVTAFGAVTLGIAVAAVAVLVVTALRAAGPAAAPPAFWTVVVAATFRACTAAGLLVVTAIQPIAAIPAQPAGSADCITPVA